MKYLLSIEFAKLRKLTSIKVIFLIYMVMVPLLIYSLGYILGQTNLPFLPTSKEFWSFPLVWKFTTYCASYFNVLMGVIIVIITCNEFTNRTLKQNIIDGLSKKETILSKYMIIVLVSIVITIFTAIIAFIYGVINSVEIDLFKNAHFIFIYFIQTLCYFSFAFFFAVLVKKSAMSILFFILSFLFETIIGAFLPKIIYQFFPLNVFSKLTPIPFMEEFIKQATKGTGEVIPIMELPSIIVLSMIYMLVFVVIAFQVLKKRDL